MTVDAIVRARMGSTRLPGKTLMVAAGKSMLAHTIERLERARTIDRVVVATSDDARDDEIASACDALGVAVFRGATEDVLGRVVSCAEAFGMTDVAHFSPDNPLVDPRLCDELIGVYLDERPDYLTNNLPPTWPDGLEVEVTSAAALGRSATHASTPDEREHFLTWIWSHQDQFRIRAVTREPSLNHVRLTLDYPEDWDVISTIFDELYPHDPQLCWEDVVAFLESRPDLQERNASRAGHYPWRPA